MFSSTSQKIVCVLIVLSSAVVAHAQSAPAKEPTSTISGKVTIQEKALAGIVISLSSSRSSAGERPVVYKAKSDVNGEYRIANVAAGNYVIMPLAPAFVVTEEMGEGRTLIVNKGETIEHIDFSLLRGGAISGKVVDADGHPVIEQEVVILNAQTNNRLYLRNSGVATDDRGIYRVYGLRPGSYKVGAGAGDEGRFGGYRPAIFKRAFHPSVADVAEATAIELSEGREVTGVDITLGRREATYSASGRIVDGATAQPLANVPYGVMHLIPNGASSMSTGAVSNSRGEFKLENLGPGKYFVQVRSQPNNSSNWRAEDVPFEIVDGDVTGLVVQTRKGAMLSGVVVFEGTEDKSAREEMRRITLAAVSAQGNERTFSSATSMIAADGSFSMSGVAAGTVVFQLGGSPRFRLARVERQGAVTGRGIEVKEGETISGLRIVVIYGSASIRGAIEVTNAILPPSARFFVWLRNLADDPVMASGASSDVDARGQFVIEGLMPGTYEVNAGVVNNETTRTTLLGAKKQQVVVTAGSVNNVTLSVELKQDPAKP